MNDSKKQTISSEEAINLVSQSLNLRHKKERNFKLIGKFAIALAMFFLATLFTIILFNGIPGLFQHYIQLEVEIDRETIDPKGDLSPQSLFEGDARSLINKALYNSLGNIDDRKEKKSARAIISSASSQRLNKIVMESPEVLGQTISIKFPVDDDIDSFLRGYIDRNVPETERRVKNQTIQFIDKLNEDGRITYEFSDYLFFGSASRDAEIAGIKGAFIGSIYTLLICLLISFPLGVSTAIYLEEIAPKNWITEFIEININNLAAVPSVVFGIMGLAVFIIAFGLPRSIPLLGGIVLALMTLPTIIISSRAAIRAVPPSIRDAAYGIGASKMQMIFHHVLPLAMPGMLTGTIIGMAQALGETAPLLMIGMVAFIVDIPGGFTDPGTVLPVQIFMWADFAERMFVHKTSAAIIILLTFLISMNIGAILLRKKLEHRW